MSEKTTDSKLTLERILEPVRRYWGFDQLRPLQEDAIRAGVVQRDSLAILPTGGGKSLCYQVPPLLTNRTDVVVSPLISLMKDQVDALQACGYPAATLHSGMSQQDRDETERAIAAGQYRLIFVSPERLLTPQFASILRQIDVRAFAIDEAHCISQWGHDFRPEYRQLATLKDRFTKASVHAFTATATLRVREDIVTQLRLSDPEILIGIFDRPNLTYRIVPRLDVHAQTAQVLRRHPNEAVIVYCLSRKDTESMADALRAEGFKAEPYHAGLSAEQRHQTQDAFANESLNIVTATVAFGMGIDRSNVRCIVHATMPKSVEHYQQETGRAGRDGLEAECVLLYSAADLMRWKSLIGRNAAESHDGEDIVAAQEVLLNHMRRFCNVPQCRHRLLSEYFGQTYSNPNCEACDVCLNEAEGVEDATEHARKILSCVARVRERFGVTHVVDVLVGSNTEMVRNCQHEQLSTYGLLKGTSRKELTNWVYQLVDQGFLERSSGDRPVLHLNEAAWEVMRGQCNVSLMRAKVEPTTKTRGAREAWEGVDVDLFEHLRGIRRTLATERGVPAYVIFGDKTLRDMARRRPGSSESLRAVHGIGDAKLEQFGDLFLREIATYSNQHDLDLDCAEYASPKKVRSRTVLPKRSVAKQQAFDLFATGASLETVATHLNRAASTVASYLGEYIEATKPSSIETWVDGPTYRRIADVARDVGTRMLKPIFEKLDGDVSYDDIRLVATHMEIRD